MEKLVRDYIPAIIEHTTGKEPNYYYIDDNRGLLLQFLFKKLQEEVEELLLAKTDLELVSEMADVYEVMQAICKEKDLDKDIFEKYASIKRQTNGGFDEHVILEDK